MSKVQTEFAAGAAAQAAIATAAAARRAGARRRAYQHRRIHDRRGRDGGNAVREVFSVVATDSTQYVTLILNNNGTPVITKVYPSSEYVDSVANEVHGARAGSPTLNDRLNAIVSSVGGTQISYGGLQAQLQTYRPTADEARLDPAGQTDVDPTTPQPLTLTLPKMIVSRFDADIVVPPTAVTFDPVSTNAVTNEAFILHYDAQAVQLSGRSSALPRRDRTHAEAGIGRNSAHEPDGLPVQGRLRHGLGTQNVPDFDCLATYTGRGRRYDRVCVNPNTGDVLIVKGTDRIVDPSEYRPAEPDGLRTMYWAYVDYRGVTLLPARYFSGYARSGAADYTRHVDWCRPPGEDDRRAARPGDPHDRLR